MSLRKSVLTLVLPLAGAALLVFALLYVSAAVVRPDLVREPRRYSADELAAVQALRDTGIDHGNLPVVVREVDYEEGAAAAWFPKGEAPMLAELVSEAKLPPVAERVGPEPLVMEGLEGNGRYGGTWFRVASSMNDIGVIGWRMSGATLVRWSPLGYPIRPHVARAWEVSEEGRVYTIHLRKGMRWSDGHPFTADDMMFWWEQDMRYFNAVPGFMRIGGEVGRVEKVDEYTVRFVFPAPHGLFIERLANVHSFALPKHYLEKFHPETGDPELIAAAMRSMRLNSPLAVYNRLKHFMNPEHPRLWPWVYRSHTANPPYGFVRNPYFFAVDSAGNQLPYVDRVLFDVRSSGMIGLAAANGEVTMQLRHIRYEDYTLLMAQRARHHYEVLHWAQGTRSVYTIFPVINRRIDPARPDTRWKHEYLNKKQFRQALSLAINRAQIIHAEFNDQTEPAQIDPGPGSFFHNPRLYRAFTEHDPDRANQLLDSIGLTRRDREGFRAFPDGTRMSFFLNVTDYTGSGPAQFVIDDWAAVGVRAILRERARSLFYAEKAGYDHDFTVWTGESEFYPLLEARNFVPTYIESFYAPAFGVWYALGGMHGDPRAERPGAVPPPADHPLRRAMQLYEQAIQQTDREAQRRIFNEALEIAAENLWHISICTPPPQLVIVKKGFRNVPKNALVGAGFATPANAGIETFWFEHPSDSPGALAQIRQSMIEITPDPSMTIGAAAPADGLAPPKPNRLGPVVRLLVWASAGLGLLLVALRHPYIGRRLLIMGPTLLIISVITFTIIQLPPGDFLSARITELQMTGDDAAVQQIEDLKAMFHFEDPQLVRYARWLGLYWFKTFSARDTGLLQGNLGRSMENGQLVNHLVGDRILLTVVLSLFTILFTWVIALPTGIYSAVRQYSLGDYLLTFIGFIGMCVPSFLLALILIYLSSEWFGVQITGLFSPAYAGQPEWTWGKFVDMMKHIWVPVVVLGVGGTAGMIRVMRGNLLDELRKPYVVTARAKGVRPLRLLLKYPVRLALNPFISSIGGIFPQLVSGGAIVSIVLSLPMVGPLMLTALLTQDMYLAGSMLMVLSLLGVFGTLVSDLLLLWLDPRIRLEGGTR
jgi:ABC-type dipeptide/oligopeptide/nickel transport system permease component/ABC-type transport system substrate-binding protein